MECKEHIEPNQTGMFLTARAINKDDLSYIKKWYVARKHQGFQCPPFDIFPETGYIIEDDIKRLYAAWLYVSNSKVHLLDWIIGDPKARNPEALQILIEHICKEAKDTYNAKYVMSVFNNNLILEKQYVTLGFMKGGNCFNYIKIL